eukprot:c48339_g1_i1 orf=13-354(-)
MHSYSFTSNWHKRIIQTLVNTGKRQHPWRSLKALQDVTSCPDLMVGSRLVVQWFEVLPSSSSTRWVHILKNKTLINSSYMHLPVQQVGFLKIQSPSRHVKCKARCIQNTTEKK